MEGNLLSVVMPLSTSSCNLHSSPCAVLGDSVWLCLTHIIMNDPDLIPCLLDAIFCKKVDNKDCINGGKGQARTHLDEITEIVLGKITLATCKPGLNFWLCWCCVAKTVVFFFLISWLLPDEIFSHWRISLRTWRFRESLCQGKSICYIVQPYFNCENSQLTKTIVLPPWSQRD